VGLCLQRHQDDSDETSKYTDDLDSHKRLPVDEEAKNCGPDSLGVLDDGEQTQRQDRNREHVGYLPDQKQEGTAADLTFEMTWNSFDYVLLEEENEEEGRDKVKRDSRECQVNEDHSFFHGMLSIDVIHRVKDAVNVDEDDGLRFV